jgi:hypothetical protein
MRRRKARYRGRSGEREEKKAEIQTGDLTYLARSHRQTLLQPPERTTATCMSHPLDPDMGGGGGGEGGGGPDPEGKGEKGRKKKAEIQTGDLTYLARSRRHAWRSRTAREREQGGRKPRPLPSPPNPMA